MAKKLKTYTLIAGNYVDTDGTNYERGAVIESRTDLVTTFMNKFVRGGTLAADAEDDDEEDEEAEEETDIGTVATDEFTDEIGDSGAYAVYKVGRRYNVHGTEPESANVPLNEAPMTKAVTRTFIEDVIAEDAE